MFDLLICVSIIGTVAQIIKEARTPTIPAENFENQKLYNDDIISGVPIEQRMKNLKNGKYRLDNKQTDVHTEPHRNPVNGKIVIENCKLYNEDCSKYGAYQADLWAKQGRYNLNAEELKKEEERLKAKYEFLYNL
jgi:predicted RNase H-like nuclease (RuvC/YqgF family)